MSYTNRNNRHRDAGVSRHRRRAGQAVLSIEEAIDARWCLVNEIPAIVRVSQ